MGFFDRISQGLQRSRDKFKEEMNVLLDRGPDLDEEFWDGLEETLILADIGGAAACDIVENLRDQATRKALPDAYAVLDMLNDQIADTFTEGGQEILDASLLRLRLADLFIQLVEPGFEGFVPGGQVVILFLVCLLVEGDVGVFVDVLLDGIGDDLRLVQQLVPLGLKLRGVKEQYHHLESVSDDRVLCSQQLVCRRQERILNLLVGQVRSGAALVAVEFVITLPDDSAVLVGRVPDL